MPALESIPYKSPGEALTFKAEAAISGKRFVKISGNRTGGPGLSTDLENIYQCEHCGAGGDAIGVSQYSVAITGEGGAHVAGVVPVTAGAAIAAGEAVMSDANGKAIPYAAAALSGDAEPLVVPRKLGIALNAAADTADAEVLLTI